MKAVYKFFINSKKRDNNIMKNKNKNNNWMLKFYKLKINKLILLTNNKNSKYKWIKWAINLTN